MTPPDLPFGVQASDLRDLARAVKAGTVTTLTCAECGGEYTLLPDLAFDADVHRFLTSLADFYDQPR